MTEYIEREAALEVLLHEMCGTGYQSQAMRAVKFIPASDVEPVRHGWWVEGKSIEKCSVCGKKGFLDWRYCPNCGAKMEKA